MINDDFLLKVNIKINKYTIIIVYLKSIISYGR